MPKSRVALSVLSVLVSACGLVTEPRDSNGFSAQRDGSTLFLENREDRPVYFFAVEQNTAALILWGACDDPERCDRVARKAQRGLPLDSIYGYKPGVKRVIVYWWHLVPSAGGGFRADSIRAAVTPL